ncbi:alpha-mannosidase [Agromyces terreus]|uniref:Alpha-mannosidase n=1 Tax=Agromyces terreus TaxID=424795 RepID=A0A9X2GWF4_9MICO|nr:glycoside hydrolase family 38 C-terminal domain-containing protein [Agromyces terreus]MCP2370305.1 alpha-mannosidase [Agromyces terreus]
MQGFPAFLFGLAAQQPTEYRRLTRIRKRIYTKVAPLRAEIVRSPEPIPFAELDRSAFRPLRDGTAWGSVFECAWVRITGEVPADASGKAGRAVRSLGSNAGNAENLVIMLGVRGEGLVHSAAGELLDSVSTVFQQGDLPHSGGQHRPVLNVDTTPGARIELYADVTYNGWILYEVGKAIYHGAHLATRDDEAYALYYDYLTLVVLAGATEDAVLEAELRRALAAAWVRFGGGGVGAIREARAALAPALAAPSTSGFLYDAVGHGHLDMAWLWPLRETRRKAARTYVRAMNAIDRRDDYVYGTSQPQQMHWMRTRHPALFERMKTAVADGRMELQGSFWVEPDTNLPSGESLVRQAMVGRAFLQQEFALTDEQLRLCWLPDTFGYNGNLPQILKKSGMDWFQTIKLAWNKVNDFPHRTFHWQGIDGSSVLVHMPPEGDYNSRAGADNLLTGLQRYPERDLDTALLVYGSGDGGGGPNEIHHQLLDREHGVDGQGLRGLPKVRRSTAGDFFRRLEQRDIAHTHVGELYLETHQGTYTTQAQIKRHNRLVERKLHEVEALAVLAGDDHRPVLEEHWREVLLNQFHDIIPGSSIERVNREAIETYERIEGELDAYATELIERMPRRGEVGGGAPVERTALNLTSHAREEVVRVGDDWFRAVVAPYAAAELQPVAAASDDLTFTDDSLGNGVVTLRFGADGVIVSCVDRDGAEHAGAGLNRLVVHRDPYVWPFNAWDIKADYVTKAPRVIPMRLVSAEVDGPTVVRTQEYRSTAVTVRQRIVLEAGSDVVRFETDVDWHEKHRMLRAEFRPTHFGETVRCEIQFGHLERVTTERDSVERAQFEVCAHKWIATDDDRGGFALLNDSKYGHRVKNGLVSLNLLRAPTFPDKTADRGRHRFTYAFTPFAPGDLAKVVREGYRLNNPLQITDAAPFASAASVDDPGVIIETLKRAEQGDGVVLRLYESLGQTTTTALRVSMPGVSTRSAARPAATDAARADSAHAFAAVETDLLERPYGAADRVDLDRLEFGPFEIKTIVLRAAS